MLICMNRINKWFHDKLHWGFLLKSEGIPFRVGGDSFQPTYQCRFCDFALCQDSQGNWFHLSSKI